MKRVFLWAILVAAIAAPAAADRADDDLQTVRKAVLASATTQTRPPAEDPTPPAQARRESRKGELKWFRVRIVEKGGGKARVSVNLPLGLVRAFGDDWEVPSYHGCRKRDRCGLKLGEILRALDAGQSLVDIEDEGATVRVWVE